MGKMCLFYLRLMENLIKKNLFSSSNIKNKECFKMHIKTTRHPERKSNRTFFEISKIFINRTIQQKKSTLETDPFLSQHQFWSTLQPESREMESQIKNSHEFIRILQRFTCEIPFFETVGLTNGGEVY